MSDQDKYQPPELPLSDDEEDYEQLEEAQSGTEYYEGELSEEPEVVERARPEVRSIPNIATDDGEVFGVTRTEQVGHLVDWWGELLEGEANKADDYLYAFFKMFNARKILDAKIVTKRITKSEILGIGNSRTMEVVTLGRVNVPVYIARQGSDLYVSWRAFYQGQNYLNLVFGEIDEEVRRALRALIALFVVFGSLFLCSGITEVLHAGLLVNSAVTICCCLFPLILAPLMVVFLLRRKTGDALKWFRGNMSEIETDDVVALSSAVHMSLKQAALELEIDTKKFEQRDPYYKTSFQRRRKL